MRRFAVSSLVCIAAAAAVPALAHAGSYHVYTCAVGGKQYSNSAWTGAAVSGFAVDTNCTAARSLIGMRIDGGKTIPNGASASLAFTSPPGTTIADFTVDRELDYDSNPAMKDTRPLYAIYLLGNTPFAGAGDYDTPTRDRLHALNSWYGYPSNDAHLTRRTTTVSQMRALDGYKGDATTMTIRVGCFKRKADCSGPAGARVFHVLYGIDLTINDPQPPAPTVAAEGLLAGGPRRGSDPVVMSATDNAGIRRIELLDVTGVPTLVGARNSSCNVRLARPCPDVTRASIVPTALTVGHRNLLVRTIDAGGNATDRGPFPVDVRTPSDRGGVNGGNVSEPATLRARFPKGDRRARTVRYGKKVRVDRPARQRVGAADHRRPDRPGDDEPPPRGAGRAAQDRHDERRRHLRADHARERVAPARARLEGAAERRRPRRDRHPDAADPRRSEPARLQPQPAARPPDDAARAPARARPRRDRAAPGPPRPAPGDTRRSPTRPPASAGASRSAIASATPPRAGSGSRSGRSSSPTSATRSRPATRAGSTFASARSPPVGSRPGVQPTEERNTWRPTS